MLKFSIKHDLKKLSRDWKAQRQAIPKAAAMAINKSASPAKTAAKRAVARETGFIQRDVLAHTKLTKATVKRLTAVLSMTGEPRNLIHFKPKRTPAGIEANAWGKKKTYRGTFIANSGRTVFKRAGRKRLPIKAVYGPGIAHTFADPEIQAAVIEVYRQKFPVEFKRALALKVKRKRRR